MRIDRLPISVLRTRYVPGGWDLLAFVLVAAFFVYVAQAAHGLTGSLARLQATPISLAPPALVGYAARTALRMLIAMLASLVFTFTYATLAAKSRRAEVILVPLLDFLQSVPILGFSITVVFFLQLTPGRVAGAEMAAIFLIFTSQAWNMAFSFYHSLRSIPDELVEVARNFQLSPWMRFWRLEVPFSMPALIWNMMMSMSGGRFLVCALGRLRLVHAARAHRAGGAVEDHAVRARRGPPGRDRPRHRARLSHAAARDGADRAREPGVGAHRRRGRHAPARREHRAADRAVPGRLPGEPAVSHRGVRHRAAEAEPGHLAEPAHDPGDSVVHSFQCDRGRLGPGSGSALRGGKPRGARLAVVAPDRVAGGVSVLRHRGHHRLGRLVECEHRGGSGHLGAREADGTRAGRLYRGGHQRGGLSAHRARHSGPESVRRHAEPAVLAAAVCARRAQVPHQLKDRS